MTDAMDVEIPALFICLAEPNYTIIHTIFMSTNTDDQTVYVVGS